MSKCLKLAHYSDIKRFYLTNFFFDIDQRCCESIYRFCI